MMLCVILFVVVSFVVLYFKEYLVKTCRIWYFKQFGPKKVSSEQTILVIGDIGAGKTYSISKAFNLPELLTQPYSLRHEARPCIYDIDALSATGALERYKIIDTKGFYSASGESMSTYLCNDVPIDTVVIVIEYSDRLNLCHHLEKTLHLSKLMYPLDGKDVTICLTKTGANSQHKKQTATEYIQSYTKQILGREIEVVILDDVDYLPFSILTNWRWSNTYCETDNNTVEEAYRKLGEQFGKC